MQILLNFLIKHNHWFLFLLLEGISFMLIVRFNNYQGAAFFTAANGFTGSVYSIFMDVNAYFNLHDENRGLLAQNMELTSEVTELRNRVAELESRVALEADTTVRANSSEYIFNTAQIVNNSLNAINNYILLDKGTTDGVRSEMGVFSSEGVVGVVYLASERYSLVIPLLNSKSNISCRIQGSNSFCALQWDGQDTRYSYLIDLPRYTKFERGDTVVTSGFSSIFPRGIPVGTIDSVEDSDDGMFYKARVRLFVDFASITSVFIVGNKGHDEQIILEKQKLKE